MGSLSRPIFARMTKLLLVSSCLMSPALLRPARAADVSDAQAKVLEAQIKEWLAGMLWPSAALPDRPVQLTPQGDRYAASIPLGNLLGSKDAAAMTADISPLDGGRWGIQNLRIPSPATFSLSIPSSEDGKTTTVPVTYTVKVADQNASGTFDPSYRTPSSFASTYRALTMQADIDGKASLTQVASSTSTSTITPAQDGRIDQAMTGTLEGYTSTSTLPDGVPLTVGFDKIGLTGEMLGVSRDKATELTRGLFTIVGAVAQAKNPDGTPDPSKIDKPALRSLITAFRGFASSGKLSETFEGITVKVGENGGSLARALLGLSVGTANGLADVKLDLGLEGLQVANPPLGPFEAFIPKRIALRPTVTGVATSDLLDLAEAALDDDSAKMNQLMAAIFSHGGIVAGLESMGLDVAGTSFTGQGKVTVPDPSQVTGSGQVVAANFDALMNQLKTLPQAQQVLPALLFAKGIGQTNGDKVTWNINYDGAKLLVNGTDVLAMMGGGAQPPAQPPTPPRAAPRQAPRPAPARPPAGPPKQ